MLEKQEDLQHTKQQLALCKLICLNIYLTSPIMHMRHRAKVIRVTPLPFSPPCKSLYWPRFKIVAAHKGGKPG
jgi:hypothetical protein